MAGMRQKWMPVVFAPVNVSQLPLWLTLPGTPTFPAVQTLSCAWESRSPRFPGAASTTIPPASQCPRSPSPLRLEDWTRSCEEAVRAAPGKGEGVMWGEPKLRERGESGERPRAECPRSPASPLPPPCPPRAVFYGQGGCCQLWVYRHLRVRRLLQSLVFPITVVTLHFVPYSVKIMWFFSFLGQALQMTLIFFSCVNLENFTDFSRFFQLDFCKHFPNVKFMLHSCDKRRLVMMCYNFIHHYVQFVNSWIIILISLIIRITGL